MPTNQTAPFLPSRLSALGGAGLAGDRARCSAPYQPLNSSADGAGAAGVAGAGSSPPAAATCGRSDLHGGRRFTSSEASAVAGGDGQWIGTGAGVVLAAVGDGGVGAGQLERAGRDRAEHELLGPLLLRRSPGRRSGCPSPGRSKPVRPSLVARSTIGCRLQLNSLVGEARRSRCSTTSPSPRPASRAGCRTTFSSPLPTGPGGGAVRRLYQVPTLPTVSSCQSSGTPVESAASSGKSL